MTGQDTDLAAVIDLERELLTSSTRSNGDRLRELLHEDFVEINCGGVVRNRAQSIEALLREDSSERLIMHDAVAARVGDGLIALRWRSERAGQGAVRTSLWRRDEVGWQLLRHQGTPIK
ncbi:DUF4440 domain-containing protein [Gordonia phthalatica]|uniref:DUF4440 domain-containing protein n=1 Tax=Gordonia phthalatica TaxID=1136941 RepID=A0A0N9NIY7_9ACTN|nr:nuclear transport factor 2 family protein [Gordonia phthalatica]ALG85542.1 hypothetical protein ACH46_14990 [Gordonia phthalatica]